MLDKRLIQNPIKSKAKGFAVVVMSLLLTACFGSDPAIEQVDKFIADQKQEKTIDTTKEAWKTSLPLPPLLAFDSQAQYFWDLQTNKGNMSIRLYADTAPMHASSTIYLTQLGFYDSLTFHRVIPGFMAQGGDPLGNGRGGPGFLYAGEFEGAPKHDKRGILSMANRGPNTDGSQFFITFGATPHLNGRHTVFGEVASGMETLDALEKLGSRSGLTKEKLTIVKATIRVES